MNSLQSALEANFDVVVIQRELRQAILMRDGAARTKARANLESADCDFADNITTLDKLVETAEGDAAIAEVRRGLSLVGAGPRSHFERGDAGRRRRHARNQERRLPGGREDARPWQTRRTDWRRRRGQGTETGRARRARPERHPPGGRRGGERGERNRHCRARFSPRECCAAQRRRGSRERLRLGADAARALHECVDGLRRAGRVLHVQQISAFDVDRPAASPQTRNLLRD